jgi:hypothetical protein
MLRAEYRELRIEVGAGNGSSMADVKNKELQSGIKEQQGPRKRMEPDTAAVLSTAELGSRTISNPESGVQTGYNGNSNSVRTRYRR